MKTIVSRDSEEVDLWSLCKVDRPENRMVQARDQAAIDVISTLQEALIPE